jgi:hypothetical protein
VSAPPPVPAAQGHPPSPGPLQARTAARDGFGRWTPGAGHWMPPWPDCDHHPDRVFGP